MSWSVAILNETIAAELAALPADIQARFLRLGDRIRLAGLESVREPHVRHLEGKLWEMRLSGRDGIAPGALRHRSGPQGCGRLSLRKEDNSRAAG
jgi:hypothetical protein